MEQCLEIFSVISGLKVNMDKSIMAGIHMEHTLLGELVDIMGCKVGTWPLK